MFQFNSTVMSFVGEFMEDLSKAFFKRCEQDKKDLSKFLLKKMSQAEIDQKPDKYASYAFQLVASLLLLLTVM